MYFTALLPTLLFLVSSTCASTTDQIDELSTNLANQIETLDINVEELTAASPAATAQVRIESLIMTIAP